MIAWVIYDIVNDRSRTKIAKYCKQAGLYRVQYSVFIGKIEQSRLDELQLKFEAIMDKDVDKIYIFPLSKKALQQTVLLGQAFDKKLVNDQVKALFL